MANQPESASYDAGIYQLEIVDSVDGGVGAKSNAPLLSLANRTAYLKQHLDALEGGTVVPIGIATLDSPAFTGSPTAPTQAAGDNTTKLATTAFVQTTVNGTGTVSIAGAATTTLTQAQYGPAVLKLTGAVTANKAVVFPSISGHWQVINNTTGAFTVTLKTAAGSGVVLSAGMSSNIYCDGVNVTLQQTDFISPALTGVPTAPTAPSGTNSLQLATTAFVQQAANGMLTKSVAGGATITLTAVEAGNSILKFTGALTANINVIVPVTPGSWRVINATTGAFTLTVKTVTGTGVGITQGLTWGVICDGTNVIDGITDFYSVALTGTPTAPTAALGNSTTQIATTAFAAALGALKADLDSATFIGTPSAPTAAAGTNTTQLATTAFVAALGALKANLASPSFTGMPLAPTAGPGTNTTQLATTAFVAALGALKANLASPILTGIPTAPTAGPGTNNAQLATTAFVAAMGAQKADMAGFQRSIGVGDIGFQKLPNGTILQFGWSGTDNNGYATFSFPIAFPNACCGFVAVGRWVYPTWPLLAGTMTRNSSQGSVAMSDKGVGVAAGFDWFAIGY